MDDAREQARAQKQAAAEHERNMPAMAKAFRDNPVAALADTSTGVIQNNFRGLAQSAAPKDAADIIGAMGRLTDAIVERGRELSIYSGPAAVASAHADIRQMRSNIYEAQVAGGSYAKVIDESSKLQTGLQDAFAPLKDEIAKTLADVLKFVNTFMPEFKELALFLRDTWIEGRDIMEGGVLTIATAITSGWDAADAVWGETLREIKLDLDIAHRKDAMNKPDPFQPWWDDPLLRLPDAQPKDDRAPDNRLGFEFFGV
jgi:hypothetical protein